MSRVLVTGGTGFIGQHLVSALAAGGRQVRVLDLRPATCAVPEVEYIAGSVLDSGLVGLGLFIAFFSTVLMGLQRAMKLTAASDASLNLHARTLMAILIAILATIATVSSVGFIPWVYWSFSGLCVAFTRIAYHERVASQRRLVASPVQS